MKIILYDDNPDYGGHQVMAVQGVEALATDSSLELVFIVNPGNQRLKNKLVDIGNCQVLESPCATRRAQGIRNQIDRSGIRKLKNLFRSIDADLLLCVQGDIEQSSQALIAARRIGLECISYIALPHSMATMGAKLGALRDACNRYLFNQPSRFIVISEGMAKLLRERGAKQRIDVVPNGIPMPPDSHLTPHSAHVTLGLLGRIEFSQKRQDFMVQTFCDHPQIFGNCRLLIAGDGPDRTKLEHCIATSTRRSEIELQAWQQDINAFFSNIDMLVIPSRYEGVPLVMLEALARGIPVIGSDCDGMQQILPHDWTFESGNADALAETFSSVRDAGQNEIGPLQQRILSSHTLDAFKSNFKAAVIK